MKLLRSENVNDMQKSIIEMCQTIYGKYDIHFSKSVHLKLHSHQLVPQIRRDNRDKLGIIFYILS